MHFELPEDEQQWEREGQKLGSKFDQCGQYFDSIGANDLIVVLYHDLRIVWEVGELRVGRQKGNLVDDFRQFFSNLLLFFGLNLFVVM